jgi:hypothetical protein
MQKNDSNSHQQQASMIAGSAQDTIQREAQSARDAFHDARDEVARKAGEYASEAKTAAIERAEDAQQDIGASPPWAGPCAQAATIWPGAISALPPNS